MLRDAQFMLKLSCWFIAGIMFTNSSSTLVFDICPIIVDFVNPRPASNMF